MLSSTLIKNNFKDIIDKHPQQSFQKVFRQVFDGFKCLQSVLILDFHQVGFRFSICFPIPSGVIKHGASWKPWTIEINDFPSEINLQSGRGFSSHYVADDTRRYILYMQVPNPSGYPKSSIGSIALFFLQIFNDHRHNYGKSHFARRTQRTFTQMFHMFSYLCKILAP